MRRTLGSLFAIAMLATPALAQKGGPPAGAPAPRPAAPAPERNVEVLNRSDTTIRQIFVFPPGQAGRSEGADRLGTDVLPPGQPYTLRLGRTPACQMQLRAVWEDASEDTLPINVCTTPQFTLNDERRRDIQLANDTDNTLTQLFIFERGNAEPGPDRLGAASVAPNDGFRVRIRGFTACQVTVRAAFQGAPAETRQVDICTEPRLTFGDASVPLREVTVINRSSVTLQSVFASRTPNWGADRLGAAVLEPGQSFPMRLRSAECQVPMAAAAAVAALVLVIGYLLFNRAMGGKTPADAGIVEISNQEMSPAGPVGAPGNPDYTVTTPESRPDPFTPLVQQAYGSPASAPERAAARPSALRERDGSSGIVVTRRVPPASVPLPGDNTGNSDTPNAGGLPSLNGGNGANADNAAGNGFGNGGRLRVGPPNGSENATNANNGNTNQGSSDSPDSYIHIQVRPQTNQTNPTTPVEVAPPAANNDDNGARAGESAMARGRRLYRSGKYRESISAYQEAGGGEAQQGVAEAHRRLGETDAARNAYREAIRIYESQGNSSGAQTCRAALEVLGG